MRKATTGKRIGTSRIFIRFLATYLIIILIPILTLGTFIYRFYFNYMKENLEKNCYASLEQVRTVHNNLVLQLDTMSGQMYLSKSFSKFQLEISPEKTLNLINELGVLKQTNHYIKEIAFHFADDPYIYSSTGSNTVAMFFGELYSNPDIYSSSGIEKIFASSQPKILPLHNIKGFRESINTVVFIYPIPMQCHTPYATVLFYVPYASYEEILGISEAMENTYIVNEGTILVQTNQLEISPFIQSEMMKDDYVLRYLEEDGNKYLAVHTGEEYSALDYYRLISLNEVYAPLRHAQAVFVLLNFILLLVCGIFMYIFSRINYSPLKKVMEALKPLPDTALTTSSNELGKLLEGIEYVYRQNKQLNLELAQSKDAKRSVVLINFIKGRYPTRDSMEHYCEELGFRNDRRFYCIWLVQFHSSSLLSPIDEEADAIFNCTREALDICSTELLTSNTLAVVSFYDEKKELEHSLAYIKNQLDSCGFQGIMGISGTYTDFSNASKAFMEASTALTHHTLGQELEIIFFAGIKPDNVQPDSYPYRLLEEYGKAVSDHNRDKLAALTERILEYVHTAGLPHFFTQCILKDAAEALIKHCILMDGDNLNLYELYNSIYSVNSMSSFEACMKQLLAAGEELISRKEPARETTGANLLLIIQYINETCKSPNFSLYNVAEHFQMSPSQLTNSFKAELHISPSAYITNYKMRMAKHLLKTTDLGIADICSELGYNDTSSFIRKFKQYVGLTPAAYRKDGTTDPDISSQPDR